MNTDSQKIPAHANNIILYSNTAFAFIDVLRLKYLHITFSNRFVFNTPQFIQFIRRTPKLEPLKEAHVVFEVGRVGVRFSSRTSGNRVLNLTIPCRELHGELLSLEQVCTSCLPPLSTVESLYIYEHLHPPLYLENNFENTLWLELLYLFAAARNLYLSKKVAPLFVLALQELIGGRTTEELPILRNIFLEELRPSRPVQECIGKFVAARQLSGHPITVSLRERHLMQDWVFESDD
jgi:hypothetical protein